MYCMCALNDVSMAFYSAPLIQDCLIETLVLSYEYTDPGLSTIFSTSPH